MEILSLERSKTVSKSLVKEINSQWIAIFSTHRDIRAGQRSHAEDQALGNACTGRTTYSNMNKIHSTTPKGNAIPTYFPGSCQNLTIQSRPPAGVYAPVVGRVIPSSVV